MKCLSTFLLLFLFSFPSSAQIFVDNQPLNEVYTGKYIQVECGGIGNRVRIDYGQSKNDFSLFIVITNEKGEPWKFNNSVQLLNFFDEHGWELLSSYKDEESFFLKRKA